MNAQECDLPALPVADGDAIHAFLDDVVGTDIHLAAITNGAPIGRWFGDDVEAASAWALDRNADGANIYWTANVCGAGVGAKPSKGDIAAARFLHVDIDPPKDGSAWDRAAARQKLDNLPIKPSVIINSGNGIQALWALDVRLENWEPIEALNRELARRLGGDNCHNIDRLLRLPGTVNYPSPAKVARGCIPVLASLISANIGPGHALADLKAAFPSGAVAGRGTAVKPPVALTSRRPVTLLTTSDLRRGNLAKLQAMIDDPEAFFRTCNRSSWAHGIACELASEGYTEDQVLGVLLNPANAGAAHVTDQPDPWRAAQRAWDSAHRPRQGVGSLFSHPARGGASVPQGARSHAELLAAASNVEKEDADAIAAIAAETAGLDNIKRDQVLRALKQRTGLGLCALKSHARSAKSGKPDHLALAQAVIEQTGPENVIFANDRLWSWTETGVWKGQDDRLFKQRIQRICQADGVTVSGNLVTGCLDVLKSEVLSPEHSFNVGDPEVVCCLNGQVELQDGLWTLVLHRRADYRTTQLPLAFDAAARAPAFLTFLDGVFRDDVDKTEKIAALLELMGYTLMAHARHEKFVILLGAGANGKSVLLRVLSALCGDENIAAVQPSKFDNAFDRAHLDQRLANIISELKQGEVLADAELKAITSGEPSSVSHKYGHPFVMRPFTTCWFGTNHMPQTRDFSDALFRRAVVLTFNRTFSEQEQDPKLADKLRAELPGILNLCLMAYARALEVGFTEPQSSVAAKGAWRLDADQAAQFVEECCDQDPAAEVSIGETYFDYKMWAVRQGIKNLLAKRGLRERLTRLGFGQRHTATTRYVTGLRLKPSNGIGASITQASV